MTPAWLTGSAVELLGIGNQISGWSHRSQVTTGKNHESAWSLNGKEMGLTMEQTAGGKRLV
jgi:hypothetical protein